MLLPSILKNLFLQLGLAKILQFFCIILLLKLNFKYKIYSEISKIVQLRTKDEFYVGIVESNPGNWTFFNGRPANDLMFDWKMGQPDKFGEKGRKCTVLYKNKLEAETCGWKLYTVCQLNNGKC